MAKETSGNSVNYCNTQHTFITMENLSPGKQYSIYVASIQNGKESVMTKVQTDIITGE